jgi:PIN domain nuclease of toxin-antitoxin system
VTDSSSLERGVLVDGDLFLKAARHQSLPERVDAVLRHGGTRRYLSVVSMWQLQLRERAGLAMLPHPVAEMLQSERLLLGLESLPLQEECLVHLHQLRDLDLGPWDQLLICQALQHRLQLLSDRPIFRALSLRSLPLEVVF